MGFRRAARSRSAGEALYGLLDDRPGLLLGNLELILGLQVEPERRRHPKGALQPEGGVGRNAAPAAHDVTDTVLRNAERLARLLALNW